MGATAASDGYSASKIANCLNGTRFVLCTNIDTRSPAPPPPATRFSTTCVPARRIVLRRAALVFGTSWSRTSLITEYRRYNGSALIRGYGVLVAAAFEYRLLLDERIFQGAELLGVCARRRVSFLAGDGVVIRICTLSFYPLRWRVLGSIQ